MQRTLGLVRHARAAGQGPEAPLLPEGADYVARLGRRLARDGWTPALACSSPYARARDTVRILLGELGSGHVPFLVPELTPDTEPQRALDALWSLRPPPGRVLVVAHLPLLGRLVAELTGETVDFLPGTFAEVELPERHARPQLLRRIGPEDL